MSIILSVIALCISAFTFWWTSLRNPKIFKLIDVKGPLSGDWMPEFALVNGSTKDLLIINIKCYFYFQEKGTLTPSQSFESGEDKFPIIKRESALRCKIKFKISFNKDFITQGEYDDNLGYYFHDMYITISWVEMNGKVYNKSNKFIRYGFNRKGEICSYQPILGSIELYNKIDLRRSIGNYSILKLSKEKALKIAKKIISGRESGREEI